MPRFFLQARCLSLVGLAHAAGCLYRIALERRIRDLSGIEPGQATAHGVLRLRKLGLIDLEGRRQILRALRDTSTAAHGGPIQWTDQQIRSAVRLLDSIDVPSVLPLFPDGLTDRQRELLDWIANECTWRSPPSLNAIRARFAVDSLRAPRPLRQLVQLGFLDRETVVHGLPGLDRFQITLPYELYLETLDDGQKGGAA